MTDRKLKSGRNAALLGLACVALLSACGGSDAPVAANPAPAAVAPPQDPEAATLARAMAMAAEANANRVRAERPGSTRLTAR